jgi:hypothetical protein
LSRLTDSCRRLWIVAVMSLVTTTSCMEPVEPTPTSTLLSIDPLNLYTTGSQTESNSTFHMELRIRNKGSRDIYLDGDYRRLEKLVDQRWKLATERDNFPFASVRVIRASQSVSIPYSMVYLRGSSPGTVLLENLRGLYRVGLRLSLTPNGSELFPLETSYSIPFSVTSN